MSTSSIELNYLHVKQIDSVQLNSVAQVPPHAIWLRDEKKMVYRLLDRAYRDDISISDTRKRLAMVASIVKGLLWLLMSLLDNHDTSNLMYWPCCKRLNQGKTPLNAGFSILDKEQTLQLCRNVPSGQHKVAIRTCPHPEKHSIISWWLMLSPPCGPNPTNHMNCLLIVLKRQHGNC